MLTSIEYRCTGEQAIKSMHELCLARRFYPTYIPNDEKAKKGSKGQSLLH